MVTSQNPIKVAVTGAAGQISYSLLFRLAAGEMFGKSQKIILQLLELDSALDALEGVAMELVDCAFPNLVDIETTSSATKAFDGVSWALMIGAFPRKAGMERRDLLSKNAQIFKEQGQALASSASSDIRSLVVGNPCNTNCLIARSNAKDIPADRWFSMMRLDENRAKSQLAQKAGVDIDQVSNLVVWGNHSSTQYPDYTNALINSVPAQQVIKDDAWLQGDFIESVQQRGAAIIKARGASSAASAANAVIDSVKSIIEPTPGKDWHSVGVSSQGQYGIPEGLQFGFPIRSNGKDWQVVEGIEIDSFSASKISLTKDELLAEKQEIKSLI